MPNKKTKEKQVKSEEQREHHKLTKFEMLSCVSHDK
jgi:hypothetical protein